MIPAYNTDRYIRKCLDSIITGQESPHNIEIIVVNDGSTDSTAEVLSKYDNSSNNCTVKIINQENVGTSTARNVGTAAASGKYILYLDSDDFIIKNTLESFLDYISRSDAEISVYGLCFFDKDGHPIDKSPVPLCKQGRGDVIFDLWLKSDFYSALRNKAVLRNFIEENNLYFPPGQVYQDVPWTAKLFAYSPKVEYADIYLYGAVARQDSVTRVKKTAHNLKSLIATYTDLSSFIRNNDNFSDLYKDSVRSVMSGTYFQILSLAKELKSEMPGAEFEEYVEYLGTERGIMKYSNKANRKYLYRAAAELFGIKFLMMLKR